MLYKGIDAATSFTLGFDKLGAAAFCSCSPPCRVGRG